MHCRRLVEFGIGLSILLLSACAGKGTKCGDGVPDHDEQCDDGNQADGDGCSKTCRFEGVCGNRICEAGEVHTCPQDCPLCGNGVCDASESVASCTPDCYCTNGTCDAGESTAVCPADCPYAPVCGNAACEPQESIATCLSDCYCTNGTCDAGETAQTCPQDCPANPVCGNGTCEPGETAQTCPQDCPANPVCGNGTCEPGETSQTCPADCPANPVCGNGTCEPGETSQTCPQDCSVSTGCTIVPQSGCPGGYKCTVDTATSNRCILAGSGTDGSPCAADSDCAPGLGCAVVNPFTMEGACRRFCRGKTAAYDSLDCSAGAGSTCFYNVSDANNTVIPNLFQCTANCDPLTGNGCLASMKCNLYGVDRNNDGAADLYTSECYSTADTNYYCQGPSVCPQGYECFNFGYGQACYRWCSSLNESTCTPLGQVCYSFPERVVIGGIEYGYCDYY